MKHSKTNPQIIKPSFPLLAYSSCAILLFGCMAFNMVLSSQLVNVGMKVANLEKQYKTLQVEKEQLTKMQTLNKSMVKVADVAENQNFVRIEKPLIVTSGSLLVTDF